MNTASLPMTATLARFNTDNAVDLTPFTLREQAYSDMIEAVRKFDGSYEEAKARFEAVGRSV